MQYNIMDYSRQELLRIMKTSFIIYVLAIDNILIGPLVVTTWIIKSLFFLTCLSSPTLFA